MPPPAKPHDLPGLTPQEVESSRNQHGPNELTPPPRTPWYTLFLEKFNDPIIRILLVAAVIALGVGAMDGHYAEGVGILLAILLATSLSFANEYKAGREFELLNRVTDDVPVRVRRNNENTTVPRRALVVGDIVLLENGEEVPADADVLEAVSVLVNESSLTGESVPVAKYPADENSPHHHDTARHAFPPHRLLRGTLLADGHAVARVSAVGDASEIGRTARAAAEQTDTETPLKKQLEKLSKVIGVVGFAMAALVFAVLVAQGARQNSLGPRQPVPHHGTGTPDATVAFHRVPLPVDPQTNPDGNAWTLERLHVEPDLPDSRENELFERAERDLDLHFRAPSTGDHVDIDMRTEDDRTLVRYRLRPAPLDPDEWYAFAMLVAFGLVVLLPVWWPIVHDALDMAGRPRPLPRWLRRPGWQCWSIALAAGAVVAVLMAVAGRAAGLLDPDATEWMRLDTATAFLRIFMIAVTIIVVAVPEGLPMSVTLSLAYAMRKMTATNNLVRRMHACETIGAATVICSDKTGTLTQNKMRVAETLFSGNPDAPDAPDYAPDPFLAESVAVNATADLGRPADDDNAASHQREPIGNPTEGALLLWLDIDKKGDYAACRDAFDETGQLPFSTENKFMATVGRSGAAPGVPVVLVKGAPEIVLDRCASERAAFFAPPTVDADGAFRVPENPPPLPDQRRARWREAIRQRQARGMRALGFAFRPLAPEDLDTPPAELARDLVWMGFCAIADPVRDEVPAAIDACRAAGIQVKVVTGDNADTAREIARGIGLWTDRDADDAVTTGEAFSDLDEQAVDGAAQRLKIMARARPLAKLRLVKTLQRQGEVVAVTGDGTNDAPALNHADVGLAMGQTGTSTAKEAADIILLDDSFQSIVNAVRWGRSLYSNIQKFILFQLTINVAALGVAVLGPFMGVGSPLTVTQMLWVNLIMDTFATLALASEPPNDAVMRRPPRSSSAFIVTLAMRRRIFGLGGAILAAFIGVVVWGRTVFPLNPDTPEGLRNLSLFFNAFVFVQFWNLFNARAFETGRSALARLSGSKPFLAIAGIIVLGQVAITQWGGALFRLSPLGMKEWLMVVGGTSVVLWGGELARWIARRRA